MLLLLLVENHLISRDTSTKNEKHGILIRLSFNMMTRFTHSLFYSEFNIRNFHGSLLFSA